MLQRIRPSLDETVPEPEPLIFKEKLALEVPVQVRATVGAAPVAVELTVTVALTLAAEAGLHWNGTMQAAPACRDSLQIEILLLLKSVAFDRVTEVMLIAVEPVLLMVTFCTGLWVEV